jgi:hypothetical protein
MAAKKGGTAGHEPVPLLGGFFHWPKGRRSTMDRQLSPEVTPVPAARRERSSRGRVVVRPLVRLASLPLRGLLVLTL